MEKKAQLQERAVQDFEASTTQLESIGAFVHGFFGQSGCCESSLLFSLELIASELATNIIRHAYSSQKHGVVRIELGIFPDRLEMCFEDFGKSFDPALVPEPDFENPQDGGRGLFIVHQLTSRLEYESREGRNSLLAVVPRKGDS